jgi:hypothetical protein
VLILPYSIALSDAEINAIERFMQRGGRVFADEQAGRMDERCHWRKATLWPGLERKGPGDVGLAPALKVEGAFLRTVRQFGASKLYGLLPQDAAPVTVPPLEGFVYDLLRGGIAAGTIEAGPGAPALLLVRPSRIARLELPASKPGAAIAVRLLDERDAGVDRSVVRMEFFDAQGRPARHYSTNVWIENGAGLAEIPFASSDAGVWTVKARDVISGLSAERQYRHSPNP